MEIIKTNKGKKKLCLDGFIYVQKRTTGEHVHWECWRRRSRRCPGSLMTNLNDEIPVPKGDHTHMPERTQINITKAKNKMKEVAKIGRDKPANILSETLETLDERTRANVPQQETLKRLIRRQRDPEFPPVPSSLRELVIDLQSSWAKTSGDDPEPYLFYDNGRDSNNRIIAYGSNEQLRHLARPDSTWYMDGNFKVYI